MEEADFKELFLKGFGKETDQTNSDIKCFECGEIAYTKNVAKWPLTQKRVTCPNNHHTLFLDYAIKYAQISEDLKEQFLLNTCAIIIKAPTA